MQKSRMATTRGSRVRLRTTTVTRLKEIKTDLTTGITHLDPTKEIRTTGDTRQVQGVGMVDITAKIKEDMGTRTLDPTGILTMDHLTGTTASIGTMKVEGVDTSTEAEAREEVVDPDTGGSEEEANQDTVTKVTGKTGLTWSAITI